MLESIIAMRLETVSVPAFLLAIIAETILVRYFGAGGSIHAKDDLVSIFLGITSLVANGAMAFVTIGVLFWATQYRLFTIPLTVPSLLLCFLLDDLRFYTHHRIAHRCRWVWAMHMVHHSSQRYSFAVALRQAWTKHFTGTMMLTVPLVLIGFHPAVVLFCGAVNATYQFFLHTEMVDKLPRWVEAIMNTPSHHRVHHGKNPMYLDSNYAGTFIIWDRLFGTFVAEDAADPPRYGLVKDIDTFNPLKIAFLEYWHVFRDIAQRGIGLKARLLYLFAPPGWSHDGSRQTSTMIQREWLASQSAPALEPAE